MGVVTGATAGSWHRERPKRASTDQNDTLIVSLPYSSFRGTLNVRCLANGEWGQRFEAPSIDSLLASSRGWECRTLKIQSVHLLQAQSFSNLRAWIQVGDLRLRLPVVPPPTTSAIVQAADYGPRCNLISFHPVQKSQVGLFSCLRHTGSSVSPRAGRCPARHHRDVRRKRNGTGSK